MATPRPVFRRALGRLDSYAALVGILVGAGIFRVTGDAYALTGPSVILGYLVLAPVIAATALPYAAFLGTTAGGTAGGDYAHIAQVFGRGRLAFLAGWLKLISYLGAAAYLALTVADYGVELLVTCGLPGAAALDRTWIAVATLLLFWSVQAGGARWFARTQTAMFLALLAAIALLVIPGVFAIRPQNYQPFFAAGATGFVTALPPLFFAYAGFEALAHHAAEVRDGSRRLPGILLRGIAMTTAIFVAMASVALGTVDGAAIRASTAPMATAAAAYLPAGAAAVVALGGVLAAATSVNATLAVPPRLAVTLAADKLLPTALGSVHSISGAPRPALLATVGVALALLLSGQLAFALNIAVLSLMLVYLLHSVALLCVQRRAPRLWSEIIRQTPARRLRAAAWISAATLAALIGTMVVHDVTAIANDSIVSRWSAGNLTALELWIFWAAAGLLLHARAAGRQDTEVRDVNARNRDFIRYEQVEKRQSYRLAEARSTTSVAETERFDDDFELRTVSMRLPEDAFAAELGTALEEIGFCVLTDHGTDPRLFATAAEHTLRMLRDTPQAAKQRYRARRHGSINAGWFPLQETSDIHPDQVEGWVLCRRAFDLGERDDYDVDAFWPDPAHERALRPLCTTQERLILPIMQAVLRYLGCDPHLYDARLTATNFALRLNYYPPQAADAPTGAGRLLGHEDVTLFTMLPAPTIEGLQILNRASAAWVRVDAPPNSLILNTGDYMQRITNDRLPSTTHRVSLPRDPALRRQPRVSFPMNVYLWEDEILEVLPGLGEPAYPPVRAEDFHTRITAKYYGDDYPR